MCVAGAAGMCGALSHCLAGTVHRTGLSQPVTGSCGWMRHSAWWRSSQHSFLKLLNHTLLNLNFCSGKLLREILIFAKTSLQILESMWDKNEFTWFDNNLVFYQKNVSGSGSKSGRRTFETLYSLINQSNSKGLLFMIRGWADSSDKTEIQQGIAHTTKTPSTTVVFGVIGFS